VLDKKGDEYKTLAKYVKNTHAATHTMYSLKIEQVRYHFVYIFLALNYWPTKGLRVLKILV
jgi:hypothetical protein